MFAVCIVLPRIYEEPLLVTTWTYTWQSLEIVCDCESVVHKVDVPAGTSWPLLARCPARGSILASDHLPSNPLVFAFWMVANGRLDCIILEKSQWDSDTIFVLLKNNVTFSVLPSPSLTYTMLKLGKKFWIHASKLVYEVFRGGGGRRWVCAF